MTNDILNKMIDLIFKQVAIEFTYSYIHTFIFNLHGKQ
jgi:hypothetical protein